MTAHLQGRLFFQSVPVPVSVSACPRLSLRVPVLVNSVCNSADNQENNESKSFGVGLSIVENLCRRFNTELSINSHKKNQFISSLIFSDSEED